MESKTVPTPTVLEYMDSTIAILLSGGLSVDLTHHALHALGSRIFGFTQELYNDSSSAAPLTTEAAAALAGRYPNVAVIALARSHDGSSVVGSGCDDQFKFEFALELVLDGVERLHQQHWSSARQPEG